MVSLAGSSSVYVETAQRGILLTPPVRQSFCRMPRRSCAPRTPDTCWRGATLSTTIVYFVLVGQSLLNFPARADAASFVTMHRQSADTPEPVCGESGEGGLSTDQVSC